MRKGLGALAAVLLTPATALAAGGHEVFSWFNLLGLHLPQYMLSAIMIAVLLVARLIGAEGLDHVAKTVHVTHDFRFPEVIFREKRRDLLNPLVQRQHLQSAFAVNSSMRSNGIGGLSVPSSLPTRPGQAALWSLG